MYGLGRTRNQHQTPSNVNGVSFFLSLMANDYFIKYVIVINYIYHDIISKLKYNMFKMRVLTIIY